MAAPSRPYAASDDVAVAGLSVILIAAYLATLVTTFMPARAASRVAPAEALRYE